MNVFELFASISLDAKKFNQGLKEAGNGVKKAGQTIKGGLKTAAKVGTVATAAVGAAAAVAGKKVLNMANDTAAAGDTIDKNSQKLGLSRKAYQEWDYVLSQSGVDINSMTAGLKTMINQVSKANKGSKDATANFKKLGISTKELETLSREELFEKSIKGLQNMKEGTERAALANTLFGRSGAQLQPLLNSSAKSVDELKKKANELGFVMSDKAVNAARDYTDSMDTLKRTFTGVKNRIMSELLPSFKSIMDGFSGLLAGQKGAEKTFEKGATNLVSSFAKALPKFGNIIMSLIKSVSKVAPDIISTLVKGISENLPLLLSSAARVVSALISALMTSGPEIANGILNLFVNGLREASNNTKDILKTLGTFVQSIFNIFTKEDGNGDTLISKVGRYILRIIRNAIEFLADEKNVKSMASDFLTIAGEVVNVIITELPDLVNTVIKAIPGIIKGLVNSFLDPKNFKKLETLVDSFSNAILKLSEALIDNLPDLISTLIDYIFTKKPQLDLALLKLVGRLIMGLVNNRIKLVTKYGSQIAKIGEDLVSGIWVGIRDSGTWLWEKISGFFGGIVDNVKKFFGIKSPSKLFRDQIGKNLARGIGVGFVDEMMNVSKQMQSVIPTDFDLYEPDYEMFSTSDNKNALANQNFNLTINNPVVRKDEDIKAISDQISESLGQMFRQRSVAYG